jgi:phosphoenolpyruvate carboxylase
MNEIQASLRNNVSLLGQLLGETIQRHLGETIFNKIELIRTLAIQARHGQLQSKQALIELLRQLPDNELLPVVKAFNQFLNLVNIAEQYNLVKRQPSNSAVKTTIDARLEEVLSRGITQQELSAAMETLSIDLVLTAHPTEVVRKSLIRKYEVVAGLLRALDHNDLSVQEISEIKRKLSQVITEIWHTDEVRKQKPSPQVEAQWGFDVIENSFWRAVPQFSRALDQALCRLTGTHLPVDGFPLRLSSWIGGDRDGNPNVTAAVTEKIIIMSRWRAAKLYAEDVNALIAQLSMSACSEELQLVVGDSTEPYRTLLKQVRDKLYATRDWCSHKLELNKELELDIYHRTEELLAPLQLCYRSLDQQGLGIIASGELLDTIRRLQCFGLTLARLDIRQEASRHTDVIAEIVRYLELGDYNSWSEQQRQAFLLEELQNKRPLVPADWRGSAEVNEVIDTFRVIAKQQSEYLGGYVISMASNASDVLAVKLLLMEFGSHLDLGVVPLFETLEDLAGAAQCIDSLLSSPGYRGVMGAHQQVMIGYSDSAKDAGQAAAAWAQYQTQEQLVKIFRQHAVAFTLFHGRGGSVGRGGGPAHLAIYAQAPGSVNGRLRVTEQGEMIRFKFGTPELAVQTMDIYLSAVLQATLLPPPEAKPIWRQYMIAIADQAVHAYRHFTRDNDEFDAYFLQVTPINELGQLALSSRPNKRKSLAGIGALRAIPWTFAWMQVRLMIPAWLGTEQAVKNPDKQLLKHMEEMYHSWPFFRTHIDLVEMVLAKTDSEIVEYYEKLLVDNRLKALGNQIRQRLTSMKDSINLIKRQTHLLDSEPSILAALKLRNPYIDPLHYLQAELLRRLRTNGKNQETVQQALKVTIAGIAAGIRNTG